ncbi:MAG TPA: prepilin-type N-terminal cleavage/methylation domain-containing protein [Thermoanaerobaculia bacterium]|nr:prepilin-type N-terminal cleavage/methylation domain-containing protein [Thermoanaerobaculia bacterium]
MHRPRQRGFSLAELLVVIAIIGIISLVTVPNFMAMQRAAKIKNSFGIFTGDVRAARQKAITKYRRVKISFPTGTTARTYSMFEEEGGAWQLVNTFPKNLEQDVYFSSSTFSDKNDDGLIDIIFLNNGTIEPVTPTAPSEYNVVIRTDSNIAYNQYKLTFGVAGQFSSAKTRWN